MLLLYFLTSFFAHSSESQSCKLHFLDKSLDETIRVIASEESPECIGLEAGTFKDIDINSEDSPTALTQKYRLNRLNDGSYKVTFNILFHEDNGNDQIAIVGKTTTNNWREKAEECLKNINGKTFGPNGEKINFTIYRGRTFYPSEIPPNYVGIKKSGRSNSGSWNENITCAGVFHELLHLTGLVDEYQERESGYVEDKNTGKFKWVEKKAEKTEFDCRKMYSENSVMASHSQAWEDSMETWDVHLDYCICDQSDGCEKYFEEKRRQASQFWEKFEKGDLGEQGKVDYPNACPAGFKKSGFSLKESIPDSLKKIFDNGGSVSLGFQQKAPFENASELPISYRFVPRKVNLLEERHFNSIVYPGCLKKNNTYYQNSQNAYRTSKINGGEGCLDMRWLSGT